jgi:putative Mn2+ efflux pump MntP
MIYICFVGFLVSFDGFICGISFGYESLRKTFIYAMFSAIVSFLFSYLFGLFGALLCNVIDFKISTVVSGLILIAIAIYSIFGTDKENKSMKEVPSILKFVACATLAIDASFGAVSLSLLGYSNIFLIAGIFGIMHFITVSIGILVNKLVFFKNFINRLAFFPSVLMFVFGLSKILY